MAALDFPASPTLNQTYTANGLTYTWNGESWLTTNPTDVSNATGILAVADGGTGQSTYTNGQLLIGNTTGNTLTKATLTQGTGITITNGTGSISLALGSIVSKMVYDNFTATTSQTTFTTSATYTSGKIEVYANGVKMRNGTDVTVTSGTSVVFATGLASGTLVDLIYPT